MLYGTSYGDWWGLWNLYNNTNVNFNAKVMFDGTTKTIWILDGVTYLDVKADIYSAWKEWVILYDFSKFPQAFETEGGKPISETERLGDTYFLINDWRIRPLNGDIPVEVVGNLYAYDMDGNPQNAYVPDESGKIAISSKVATIVNTVVMEVPAVVSADEIANAVWSAVASMFNSDGTTGKLLNYLDAAISSRLPASSYVAPPTALQNAETLLGLTALDYNAAGTVGEKINDIGSAIVDVDYTAVENAVWNARISDHNIGGTFGKRIRNISEDVVWSGDVVSATANTISLALDASAQTGAYDPAEIMILEDGLGVGQCRLILHYDGPTRTAVVDRNWKVLPSAGAVAVITASSGREHVNEGLSQGGSTDTIVLNDAASGDDNAYIGQVIFIRSGTGEDQARRVTAYNGLTKMATVHHPWATIPDTTSAYVMLPTAVMGARFISDAVYNADITDNTAVGSRGEQFNRVDTRVDTNVSSRLAATDYTAGLTPEQEVTLNLAHEEARRARALATNNVQINRTGTGVGQVDEIIVYDDDGVSELYRIKVYGDKAESRAVQYIKPY